MGGLDSEEFKRLVDGICSDCSSVLLPPESGLNAVGQAVVPMALVRKTRGYIEKIAHQINGSYANGWYDACSVMIRRLLETLLIEAFEERGLAKKIENQQGDFFYLGGLIDAALSEPSWNLSRNAKRALPNLKDVGDKSAHSRRFNAIRPDIERTITDLRVVVQELIYLAGIK
jgi:hypothetical protein